MVNDEIRKALENYCEENELEEDECPLLLDNPAFDNSIVGITSDNRLVYDRSKMVEELSEEFAQNGSNDPEIEAEDFISYDTERAIPYFGEHRPIIVELNVKDLIERYL